MASTRVKWNGDLWQMRFENRLVDNVRRAADFVADATRKNISTPGPPSSSPGEYPHIDRGDLAGSIRSEVDRDTLAGKVVAGAPHAGAVEQIRPFLVRTLEENSDEIVRRLTEPVE